MSSLLGVINGNLNAADLALSLIVEILMLVELTFIILVGINNKEDYFLFHHALHTRLFCQF